MNEEDIVVEVEQVEKVEMKAGIVVGRSKQDGKLVFKGRINKGEVVNLHVDNIDKMIEVLRSFESSMGGIVASHIKRLEKLKYHLTGKREHEPRGEITYEMKEMKPEDEMRKHGKASTFY